MSCGNPHEVDCSDVIEQVYLYLDGEIDDTQRTIVRQHLDECAPCLRRFGLENEVKALVARSCGGDTAPDGLKQRLMVRVQEVRGELTTIEDRADGTRPRAVAWGDGELAGHRRRWLHRRTRRASVA